MAVPIAHRKYVQHRPPHYNERINGKKKGPQSIAAGNMVAHCQRLPQTPQPPTPNRITDADAEEARMVESVLLFSVGLSANASTSMDKPLLDAFLAVKGTRHHCPRQLTLPAREKPSAATASNSSARLLLHSEPQSRRRRA